MIKILNFKDYDKYINELSIPLSIAHQVYGDLALIEKNMARFKREDDNSRVYVMTDEEFKNIDTSELCDIDKDSYEISDIVCVDSTQYITRIIYLVNNGETGIIIYVIKNFGLVNNLFDERFYITANARNHLSDKLVNLLFRMIEKSRVKLCNRLDYLQVFDIKNLGDKVIKVIHKQEEPENSDEYILEDMECENCRLFWISSFDENGDEYSTLMMAEDY